MRIEEIRSLFGGIDNEAVSAERFLLTLVRTVRGDGRDAGRGARDLYVAARKRRRRLAVMSIGTGPFAGVANQLADLYCETATVCDLATLHRLDLSDEEIGAHMLVLWGLSERYPAALKTMGGEPPLAQVLATQLRELAGEQMPEQLTKRSITKAIWDIRAAIGDARKGATTGAMRTAALTGHRTKKLIRKLEAQLGVAG
ncbi:MAG TPA: hypothetical protein VNB59_01505 [Solirubrobacterales bacterium]|jgi:hypothetical protein|nr:hypothetical protein [Solirubrobacterales bacterium]